MSNESWSEFHKNKIEANYPMWPVEAMVKVFFGSYLKERFRVEKGMNVLDIGCGFGNNLLPFYVKGCNCYGVELTEEIVNVSKDAMAQRGIHDMNFLVGHNRSLPFENEKFDILISNNVLHYENSEAGINSALKEYDRVLKKGGVAYIMSVGPQHLIYKNAIPQGGQLYKIDQYDFRNGEVYFYFDNEKKFKFYLDQHFKSVEVGRVTEKLMTIDLDFLISFSRK